MTIIALLSTIFLAMTTSVLAVTKNSEKCVSLGEQEACCPDNGKVGERTIFVQRTKNPITDEPMDILTKLIGTQGISLVREGDLHWIGWKFGDMEAPVFIIDDAHRTLPGFVRLGKREAQKIQWMVIQKTMLQFELSREEFLAAKDGVVVRVENTWIDPSYQHVLDFSCAAAWKLLEETPRNAQKRQESLRIAPK